MSEENPMGIRTTNAGTSSDVIVPRAQWNTQQNELKRLRGIEARLLAKWKRSNKHEMTGEITSFIQAAEQTLIVHALGYVPKDGSDGDESEI